MTCGTMASVTINNHASKIIEATSLIIIFACIMHASRRDHDRGPFLFLARPCDLLDHLTFAMNLELRDDVIICN